MHEYVQNSLVNNKYTKAEKNNKCGSTQESKCYTKGYFFSSGPGNNNKTDGGMRRRKN